MPEEGWAGLIETLAVDRIWDDDQRDIRLRLGETALEESLPPADRYWNHNWGPQHDYRPDKPGDSFSWNMVDDQLLRAQARFLCDPGEDALIDAVEPFGVELGKVVTTYFHSDGSFHTNVPAQQGPYRWRMY